MVTHLQKVNKIGLQTGKRYKYHNNNVEEDKEGLQIDLTLSQSASAQYQSGSQSVSQSVSQLMCHCADLSSTIQTDLVMLVLQWIFCKNIRTMYARMEINRGTDE